MGSRGRGAGGMTSPAGSFNQTRTPNSVKSRLTLRGGARGRGARGGPTSLVSTGVKGSVSVKLSCYIMFIFMFNNIQLLIYYV